MTKRRGYLRLDDRTEVRVRHVVQDYDRHGTPRVFVRKGVRKMRIRALANAEEFWPAYRAALAALESGEVMGSVTLKSAAPGSLAWLVQSYCASPEFMALHQSTQSKRRAILTAICREHGDKPFNKMESKHVRLLIRDPKAATPEAANGRVKALRQVFVWAVDVGHAIANPARDVPMLASKNPDGFHAWTREEVRQYEARHPTGTKARLAMTLFLLTGVRISDAVLLGPQMERDGNLVFTESKNKSTAPKHREVPILPALRAELDANPSGHLSYLVTEHGRPYASPKALGNRFKSWCNMAGLPQCTAHGLRKAGATFAAEHGATEHEIMSIFGWSSPKQSSLYTRKANRNQLAANAMAKVDPDYMANESVPLDASVSAGGTKRGEKS